MSTPRAHPSPAIPFLLLGIMGLLAVVAAVIGVATGGPPAGSVPGTDIVAGDTVPTVADLGPTSFTGPGPFTAGEATASLPDGVPVEFWYPATRASAAGKPEFHYDVATWLPAFLLKLLPPGFRVTYPAGAVRGLPVAAGRFPVVVFFHGTAGFRDQSTFLTARLATWGFVVAAPDMPAYDLTGVLSGKLALPAHLHPGTESRATPAELTQARTDLAEAEATVSLLGRVDGQSGSPLAGHLDLSRIAAIGHSAGGGLAEEVAASDPAVTTFIGLAGASGFTAARRGAGSLVPDKPGMLMVGTRDRIVGEAAIVQAYAAMSSPKRLITIRGAGHLVFSDICRIDPAQGGLLGAAKYIHLTVPPVLAQLATDGCDPPDLAATRAWPVIRQAVTAQLRHVFGFDDSTAGLDGLQQAFPVVEVNASSG